MESVRFFGVVLDSCPWVFGFQEKRRAERAEQQRIRAERDKERQARREVGHRQRHVAAYGAHSHLYKYTSYCWCLLE